VLVSSPSLSSGDVSRGCVLSTRGGGLTFARARARACAAPAPPPPPIPAPFAPPAPFTPRRFVLGCRRRSPRPTALGSGSGTGSWLGLLRMLMLVASPGRP
jgi:hypothetical protein